MRVKIDEKSNVYEGRLEFRVGEGATDTGVFLVRGEECFEVLAVTRAARAPLGRLERNRDGMQAKVVGTARTRTLGAFIEATDIEVLDRAAIATTACFGAALLSLYEASAAVEPAENPPRRLGNMYFHPERDGVVLEQVYLQASSHGVAAALLDPESGDVWFRTVDLSSSAFVDIIRGPYRLSWTSENRARSRG
jgi:hypothetical protein